MPESEIIKALSSPAFVNAAQYLCGGIGIKKLYDDFASPSIKQAGILGAKIFLALTISANVWAERRIKRFQTLQDDVTKKLNGVNPENITDTPPEYIIAPALNSYMYAMDKKELRDMYANLISRSMLKDFDNKIHPGFVSIIQNLHPEESILLSYIHTKKDIPLGEARWIDSDNSYNVDFQCIYLYPHDIVKTSCSDDDSLSISTFSDSRLGNAAYISNLTRLGLVTTSYEKCLNNSEKYNDINSLNIISDSRKNCESAGKTFRLTQGIISITPLGISFCNICMD